MLNSMIGSEDSLKKRPKMEENHSSGLKPTGRSVKDSDRKPNGFSSGRCLLSQEQAQSTKAAQSKGPRAKPRGVREEFPQEVAHSGTYGVVLLSRELWGRKTRSMRSGERSGMVCLIESEYTTLRNLF